MLFSVIICRIWSFATAINKLLFDKNCHICNSYQKGAIFYQSHKVFYTTPSGAPAENRKVQRYSAVLPVYFQPVSNFRHNPSDLFPCSFSHYKQHCTCGQCSHQASRRDRSSIPCLCRFISALIFAAQVLTVCAASFVIVLPAVSFRTSCSFASARAFTAASTSSWSSTDRAVSASTAFAFARAAV